MHHQPTLVKDVLRQRYPGVPKYDISFALERGFVRVDGELVWDESLNIKPKQRVEMQSVPYPSFQDVAEMLVFEDEHLMILNKPFNLASQPTADRGRINLVDLVRDFIWQRDHVVFEPGVVHRLDKDTSGLIIYLKQKELHKAFDKMFQNHRIQKTYWARVAGQPSPLSGTWLHELSEFPDPATKRVVCKDSGIGIQDSGKFKFRQAKTHFRVLASDVRSHLLELKPQTGRMHQLRVQCALAACPILGDVLYADALNARHPLMYLHAYALEFVHPVTRKEIGVRREPGWGNSLNLFGDAETP